MNKTVALACAVSAALFAAGFILPPSFDVAQGVGGARSASQAAQGGPALVDLFDPVKSRGAQGQGAPRF